MNMFKKEVKVQKKKTQPKLPKVKNEMCQMENELNEVTAIKN